MVDSRVSDGHDMNDLNTPHLIALRQGIGIRRRGHVDDDCYDLVNTDDGSLVARALTRDQVAAELQGDYQP
jgi:hypothetical protein